MLNLFRRSRRDKREIFEYWDGQSTRRADPLLLWRNMLSSTTCSAERDLPAAFGFGEEGKAVEYDAESESRVLALTLELFEITAYSEDNPTGLTIAERLELLTSFLQYMGELKKKHSFSLTLPVPSDPKSSDESTTQHESESSSMPSELKEGEFSRSFKRSDPPSPAT